MQAAMKEVRSKTSLIHSSRDMPPTTYTAGPYAASSSHKALIIHTVFVIF